MPEFLPEELNLIYLYDPGNLHGLIYELRSMMAVLMPETCSPEAALLHFNLGLEQELTETED